MKPIRIEFIEQGKHRYDTVGDYGESESEMWFKITRFENPMYSLAVLIHELYEKFRKDQEGVPDSVVDEFDLSHPELDDPGLSLEAPYHKQHMEADVLERAAIAMSGNDWIAYEEAINALFKEAFI